MVVDDDPAGQRLIKYMLTPEGHEVITASNGLQGLQMATQQSPDLVILDVMLPGLDGFEVCRRLRSSANTANIRIVMLSGKSQASDRDTGLKMGADEYLIKPVDRQELLNTVNNLLGQKAATSRRQGKILTFIGSRGGAGTSTITTSVSVALAGKGHSTLLVDLSPSFSTLSDMMGLTIEQSITPLFRGVAGTINVEGINELLVQHSSGVRLLWSEVSPEETGSVTRENIEALLQELGNMADYIIVDVPASPSDHAIAALTKADSVILVTGAGKESLERIDTVISRLQRLGVTNDRLRLVLVDRTGGNGGDETALAVAGGVPVLGFIRYSDKECAEAESSSTPVILNSPASQIAGDLANLASRLMEIE